MHQFRPRRLAAVAAVGVIAALGVPGVPLSQARADSPATAPQSATVIESGPLSVQVDTRFPDVLGYQWNQTGGELGGHTGATPQLVLNGKAYTPTVSAKAARDNGGYTMGVPELGATLTARLSVSGDVLDFKITKLSEGATPISTVAIPGQQLVSVRADQNDASVADANIYSAHYAPGPQLDTIKPVSSLSTDASPQQKEVAILNNAGAAAAIWSNAIQNYGNLLVQTTSQNGVNQTAAWSNSWTYRGTDGKVVALPEAKVVVTGDRNADRAVTWQDGAIAYREIMTAPVGASAVKDHVVSQIAFNMSSQAEHPFIQTLDDLKKVSLITDGLGQSVELKGYQDEGHDTSHPDYAGHYNQMAGGLPDLRTVVKDAKAYNATVGVHINDEMESPRANAFRWDKGDNPTAPSSPYVFEDTSYSTDTAKDLASGDFASRLAALVKDVPGLGFVYTDAFYGESDWTAWKEANVVNGLGLPLETEFPTYIWPYVTWYHDSNEYNNVGINSQIMRFVYNSDADAWIQNSQPMLGGEQNHGFEGWHGGTGTDFNSTINEVFTNNLPTKWLQNFKITNWQDNEIDFTGGVKTTMNGSTPQIWQNGVLLRDGTEEFLPYDPHKQSKIYAWSGSGEARTWTLPTTWDTQRKVQLYQLTQTGKKPVASLPVGASHQVTLRLDKNTPYVLYPADAVKAAATPGTPLLNSATAQSVGYGHGGIVKDAEFYSQSFQDWKPSSASHDVSGIKIVTDAKGFQNLEISGAHEGQVSQRLTGLTPGTTYAIGAWAKVTGHRTATVQVSNYGGPTESHSIDQPTPPQDDANSRLIGQNFQRVQVLFTMPRGHSSATLTLLGGPGAASGDIVDFTDLHGQADSGADNHADGHFYTEDFEHVAQGWGPFIAGRPQEQSIARSETHTGYTRDTISGKYSLETIHNGAGLQYRTWPGTISFQPGHAYRVRLDYQSDSAGLYDFQIGADGVSTPLVDLPLGRTTDRTLNSPPAATGPKPAGWTDSLPPQYSAPHASIDTTFAAGSCGDVYLALNQNSAVNGAATIDNLVVDDLGPAPSAADACTPQSSLKITSAAAKPGVATPVTVDFTNTSGETEKGVDTTLDVPSGWQVTGSATHADSVAPGARVTATFEVTAPADAAGKANLLAAHAGYTWEGRAAGASATTNALVPYANLAAAFNNVGITDNANTAPGGFDSAGDSFSAQELAAAGATPGSTVTAGGVNFTWPNVPAGTPDNVAASGQSITVSGTGSLGFLASSAGSTHTGPVTIHYTDGSTSTAILGVPNWCCQSLTGWGATVALKTVGNNAPTGNRQNGYDYDIFYNSVPLTPGKTASWVTLPSNTALHIFALGFPATT